MQNFRRCLEYSNAFVLSDIERFRGGVDHGLAALRLAATADGVDLHEKDEAMYASLMAELQDLIDRKLGVPEHATGDDIQPRKGTLAWYIQRRHEPVAPGSDLTLLQVCYSLMFTKHFRGTNDVGMEELCGLLSVGGLLPPDNIMPKYAVSRVAMVHMCVLLVLLSATLSDLSYAGHNIS